MITFPVRILIILLGFPLLIIPTIYASIKDLNELPWGFNKIYGNAEDGWNGNGLQRRYWGGQGWWPAYLKVNWYELSPLKRWWLSYKWCAYRNPAWNLRLLPWFSISVEALDIIKFSHRGTTDTQIKSGTTEHYYDVSFETTSGRKCKSHFRYKRINSSAFLYIRWGWKIYPNYMIAGGKMPINKDRSVYALQIKIIKVQND